MKITHNQFILFGIFLLSVAGLTFMFHTEEKEQDVVEVDNNSQVPSTDSAKNYVRNEDRKKDRLKTSREVTRRKIDRSNPDQAFNTIIDSLESSDFKAFFESFSESGKNEFSEGAKVSEEELVAMGDQLKSAGFGNLLILSKDLEEGENFAAVDATVESFRGSRKITEKLQIKFSKIGGEWLADTFEIEPSYE